MFHLTTIIILMILPCFLSLITAKSISDTNDDDDINNDNFNNNSHSNILIDEYDSIYWYLQAYRNIKRRQQLIPLANQPAKNVILFIGDGMGISTITASRILKGQQQQHNGEDAILEMDRFPFTALIKTYNVDQQVPDSAATATAFLSGVKNNFHTIGVTAKIKLNDLDCDSVQRNSIESVFSWALKSGKVAGIVTTTRVTHATPAAAYAHIQNRKWESNIDKSSIDDLINRTLCKDIALQLIENDPGKRLNVILGGGRKGFLPKYVKDPRGIKYDKKVKYGEREDGRNLIEEWLANQRLYGMNETEYAYINSTRGLRSLDYTRIKSLFGLFNYTHMEFDQLRDKSIDGEPSLSEMTEAAIKILSKHDKGFILLIEGGLIDQAHHRGYASLSLNEVLEFDRSIKLTRSLFSSRNDTLLIVTADHSQPLVINGYSTRDHRITGLSQRYDSNQLPFTTLSYASGPGFRPLSELSKITNETLEQLTYNPRYRYRSGMYTKKSYHSGEDVAIFSEGPMSYLFGGTLEQSYIAHAIGFASCIGPYSSEIHCRKSILNSFSTSSSTTIKTKTSNVHFSNILTSLLWLNTPEMLIILFITAGLIFLITLLLITKFMFKIPKK